MGKKLWCASPSDPVINQIARKYNLSQKNAKTVLNKAKSNDAALQGQELTMDILEASSEFKKALEAYTQEIVSTENALLKDVPGEARTVQEYKDQIKEDYDVEMTDDEAQEELERFNDIPRSVKISKKNARKIAAVLRAFPDARRMEFLGNWICRALSEYVTRIQTDPQFRKQYKIKKQNKRIDYFTDTNAMNGFRAYVFGDESISDKPGIVEAQAGRLLSEGKTQLASELKAAYDNMETLFFLYGGNIFREEGIDVNIDGLFSKTDSQPDSVERNEADTQDEDDEDNNDGENVVTTFSASDQNKSILTKMVPEIRTLLNTLHEKTQGGEDKTDAFGYGLWTYVSSQQAVNKLLRLCKGCETYSEMMKVLTANQHNTPWLTQLIGAMDTDSQMDASGKIKTSKSKKQQLQTMFFQSFRKQFTRFRHIYQSIDENGDIIFIPEESNQKSKTAKLMNKVQTRYRKMKGMGIMSGGKLNPDVLTEIEKKVGHGERSKNFGEIGMSLDAAKARAKRLMQAARESGRAQDYKEVSDMLDKVQDSVQEVMKQLGIDATPQMLSDYSANDPMNRSAANIFGAGSEKYIDQSLATRFIRLQSLIKQVKNLNEKLKTWADSEKDDLSVSPFSRKVADTDAAYPVRSAYRTLIANITEFSPDSFESQAHVNKKDYYSWNNPSSMLTVIERLKSGNREAVREYIRSKYCKDKLWYLMPEEGMGTLRDERLSVRTEKDGPVFYSDLLESLYYGNESQELDYSEVLQFSGETYNDMTDVSYALAMLSDYFTIQDFGLKSAKGHAWYRMFISGDKPRYVSVRLPRYSERSTAYPEKDFRNIISRKAVDFFAQELRRSENVFRYAATHRDGLRIQGYDVDPNDSKYKAVFDKRKYGKAITVEDVVKDGRYIFRNTGVSFFLNKFINDEIENNTPLGQYVVDRIFNSHMHREARDVVDVSIMDTFKQAFAAYMKATRDELLQHYQDIGLLAEKVSKDEDGNASLHLKYLIGNMRQWNIDIPKYGKFALATAAERDRLALEYGKDLDQKENKKYKTYYTEKAQFAAELEEYVYNNWLAKANMSELFDVDLAFYGDTPNFQKRNAQVVSSGHITDPEARIHDEKVSDGFYRTITLLTTKTPSEQLDQIEQLLMRRLSQITDPLQRKQFEIGIKDTISKLKKQDTTDGQAFVGLTALRKRRAGQGEWSISDDSETDDRLDVYTDEAVYRRMKKGYKGIPEKVKTNDMLHVFAQVQKDFVYTTDHFEREGRGTISVPVQHKNSEYMLSFLTAFAALENPGSQLEAIARFLEETAEKDITAGIDTVNFDSAVKIGGNNKAIDLLGKIGAETLQILRKSVYKDPKVRTKENYRPGVVTVYDNKDYKIVQEKPEHYKNTQQPTGSQFKILAINNIPDTTTITLPNGKKITGKELKQRYFSLLRYKTKSMEADFRKSFGLRRPASKRLHKLSVALKNAMSTDRKFTVEMRRSLSIVERDGIDRFVTPLDEPGIQSAVEALLMSKTRRAYYKQRTNGGIAVQAASWGKSKKLNIRFYSSDPSDTNGILKTFEEFKKANPSIKNVEEEYKNYKKNHQQGYAYFEIEAPMPTYVREMIQNPDGSISSYFLNEDGSWNMKELKKVLPDSVFDAICYRVPTEAKYSIMACRIVQFGKENSGSELIFPEELTTFTGSDFDIDTDTVELRPAPSQRKNKDIDNELFDLELAALRSDPAIGETFKPGDFSDLSEASYYMTLLESGLYTKEQLDEMDPKTWKELCKQVEDLDLMSPMTDIILHNQNSDAKSMIGIAAVGVTSHAFMSLYNDVDTNNPKRDPRKSKKNFLRMSFKETDGSKKVGESFTVLNDKDTNRRNWTTLDVRGEALLDMMYDMDGKLISTEISKYVGASADAAKDAALYRLGLNQRTLPIAILMHRLGISSDVIRAFMKQPIIKDLLYRLNMPTDYGKISIAEACRSLREDMMRSAFAENTEKERQAMLKNVMNGIKTNPDIVISYSELVSSINEPEARDEKEAQERMMRAFEVLYIFETLANKAEKLRNLDGFVRYNSSNAMKGSSFFDRYVSQKRLQKLEDTLTGEDALFKLPADIELMPEFGVSEFGKLCSMFPHIAQTIFGEQEMLNDLILENMRTYNPAFFDLVERFQIGENADAMRTLYAGWKNYLLFASDKRIADFRNSDNMARAYTREYASLYEQDKEELEKDPETKEFLENNTFVQSIDVIPAKDGYGDFDVLKSDSLYLSGPELEAYQRDWETLVKNPKTRQFATEIAIHFLARSAAFARDTPVTLMPYEVKKAIPGYLDAFREADKIIFDEVEKDRFIIDFLRNNSHDRTFVPYVKEKEGNRYPHIVADVTGAPVLKCEMGSSSSLSKNIYKVKNGEEVHYFMRSPIIQFEKLNGERQLYVATDDEIEVQKIGKETYYLIPVDETTPLGIPYQLSEYTAKDYTEPSMYLDEGQETPNAEGADENRRMEPEVTDSDIEDYILASDYVYRGQQVGTYFDDPLFETDIDADVTEALAREPIDYKRNPFLETRTYLRRAGRLARAMGLNLRTTQRGYTADGEAAYHFNVTNPTGENAHKDAMRLGAVMSALSGKKNSGVIITTYVRDASQANSVLFTVKVDVSEKNIKSLQVDPMVLADYNADSKELTFFHYFNSDEMGERLSEIKGFIEDTKDILEREGLSGKAELSFAVKDYMSNEDKINLLKEIRDESREEESGRDYERENPENVGERGDDAKREVRFSDIVDLAIDRASGKNVEDKISAIFNERYSPLTSADTSYKSRRLSDAVQGKLSDMESLRAVETADLYETMDKVVSGKTSSKSKRLHAVDNLIVNVANWIMGNRSEDELIGMLHGLDFQENEAENIIATIKQELKEQNIC